MAKKSKKANPYGFKNHYEAVQKADEEYPCNIETLQGLNESRNLPLKTKDDVRFFVLMNHVRAIADRLDSSLEATYLSRIQDNILRAAEKHLR